MNDQFDDLPAGVRERVITDARTDIAQAKEMINEVLLNVGQHRQELASMSEEGRVAMMARQILEWGDASGISVITAVALMRLGGFR